MFVNLPSETLIWKKKSALGRRFTRRFRLTCAFMKNASFPSSKQTQRQNSNTATIMIKLSMLQSWAHQKAAGSYNFATKKKRCGKPHIANDCFLRYVSTICPAFYCGQNCQLYMSLILVAVQDRHVKGKNKMVHSSERMSSVPLTCPPYIQYPMMLWATTGVHRSHMAHY